MAGLRAGWRIGLSAAMVGAALLGCQPAGTLSGAAGSPAAAAAGGSSGGGVVKEEIVDPTLNNMHAVEVTIPANWHFQGTLLQGGKCVPTPFPVFRVTSADGLSAMEREPTIGWKFGTGPMATAGQTDCLPLKSALGAQAFLKYLAPAMNLTYVADVAEPAAEDAAAQQGLQAAIAVYAPKYAAEHLQQPTSTRELARARVSYRNGTFAMQGELRVTVDCTTTVFPGMKSILRGIPDRPESDVTQCNAATRFYSSPADKLAEVLAQWDAPGMGAVGLQDWQQAWVNRNQQQADQMMAQMQQQTQAAMAASRQMFQQSMAVQNQMHQQFMAQMQAGTNASMARTQASMDARSTAASDWVNFALDQQTVVNPSTGQASTVSNAYSYTWVDSSGKTSYQTNDGNANPNGVLQGTWTRQQVVHGDGTAMN